MEVLEEVDITPKDALKLLKKFSQDPFLEENDPDLSKSVNLIYQNLVSTSFEIAAAAPDDSAPAAPEEPKKHRRHRSRGDETAEQAE